MAVMDLEFFPQRPDTNPKIYAYEHIGAFKGKVLIIRGSKDFIVSDDVCSKAADIYSDCTMKTIEGAGHGFNRENYSMGGDFDGEVWTYIDEYLKTW